MGMRAWQAVSVVLAFCVMASVATSAEQQTRFVISAPTLISFFPDYTDNDILADGGNEALNDFVFYLPAAEDKLRFRPWTAAAGRFPPKEGRGRCGPARDANCSS